MASEVAFNVEMADQLAAEADRGHRLLEKFELSEAEEIFRGVLQRVPTYRETRSDRLIVGALLGLAEIHFKHCRSVRDRELEWLCGMLFALLFYKSSAEICGKVIRHRQPKGESTRRGRGRGRAGADASDISSSSETSQWSDGEYFADMLSRAKGQVNAIELCLLEGFRGKVLERCTPYPQSAPSRRKMAFDVTWLDTLWDFCVRSAVGYSEVEASPCDEDGTIKAGENARLSSGSNSTRPLSGPHLDKGASNLPTSQLPDTYGIKRNCPSPAHSSSSCCSSTLAVRKKKINFDRFQDAIKQFVSEVSHDIRNRYQHISGKVPHGLLEQRLCSELALRLSPGTEDSEELQHIFQALLEEENESQLDPMEDGTTDIVSERHSSDEELDEEDEDGAVETVLLYVTPSATHSEKAAPAYRQTNNELVCYDKGQNSSGLVPTPLRCEAKSSAVAIGSNARKNNFQVTNLAGAADDQLKATNQNRPVSLNVHASTTSGARSGILTKWRGGDGEKNSLLGSRPTWVVEGFEEMSQFTEKKERRRKECSSLSSAESETGVLHRYINESKLSHLLACVAIKLADSFRKESRFSDSSQMYKYAFGIFSAYPLVGGHQEMLARLLVDIGATSCNVGELEVGSQLMTEAATLYENAHEMLRLADVLYQTGNVFLTDKLRTESLLARVMQLTKEEVKEGERWNEQVELDDSSDRSSSCETDADDENTYCTCIYEAITCYKRALSILDGIRDSSHENPNPDLLANILSNLADCYMMTGNLDRAERCYEEALHLFTSTFGTALLQKNAHVLCLLGTLSFLTRNYVRAATMYETSYILRQHLPDSEDPTLEMTWSLTMLGLAYFTLGHYHKSVAWCIRAFKLYTRFFRDRLLFVDPLSRWFVVQNLYILGVAYGTLNLHKKALHYLNFCRNMATIDPEVQDPEQLVLVLLALGDTHSALDEDANALKYYAEAKEHADLIKDEASRVEDADEWLAREVQSRLMGERSTNAGLSGSIQNRALVHQRDVEISIKDDMVAILMRLGISSSFETDIDWAIGCYDECVQGYRDLREPQEAARALATLATLCHVKGRVKSGDAERDDFLEKAERYFKEAVDMVDTSSPVGVQFGNFLYCEGRPAEALNVLLPFMFCQRPDDVELSYNNIEQVVLPKHLHCFVEEEETLVLEARVFAKFLGLLCYRDLRLTCDADDALVELFRVVVNGPSKPLNYTLLGYALLEVGLFHEAAGAFVWSYRLHPVSDLLYFNARMSVLLSAHAAVTSALASIRRFVFRKWKVDRNAFRRIRNCPIVDDTFSAGKQPPVYGSGGKSSGYESGWIDQTGILSGAPGREPRRSDTDRHRETIVLRGATVNHVDDFRLERRRDDGSAAGGGRRRPASVYAPSSDLWNRPNTAIEHQNQEQMGNFPAAHGASKLQENTRDNRQADETGRSGAGERKKWRSRLYHNLLDIPGNGASHAGEAGQSAAAAGVDLTDSRHLQQRYRDNTG